MSLVVAAGLAAAAVSASVVVHARHGSSVVTGLGGTGASGTRGGSHQGHGAAGGLPRAGAYVPAYDLASDPVFPTLTDGYAIERHTTGGVTSEHLAESRDGGRSWYLTGAAFPFETGYSQVQFISLEHGYAFGPAGLAVTYDAGRHWAAEPVLGGALQRVVPIGSNVWATDAVCSGPPVADTTCTVALGISTNGGRSWRRAGPLPITEARAGGDILARVTPTKAYVISYGPTGGGLALTLDSGQQWQQLPDPCAAWRTVDLAALSGGDLWMICGGQPTLGGAASPKAVYRSFDGGLHDVLEASTGFGPASPGGAARSGPVGRIAFSGQLSQLATISPSRAWIGVSGLGVLVTTDYGRTWQQAKGIDDPNPDGGVGVTFDDAENGWAIAFHVGVWRTRDAVTWRLIDGH